MYLDVYYGLEYCQSRILRMDHNPAYICDSSRQLALMSLMFLISLTAIKRSEKPLFADAEPSNDGQNGHCYKKKNKAETNAGRFS